jgi:AraC-like DNA-binding protein
MRHDDEPPIRGFALTHPGGPARLPQSEDWDQLIYASYGVLTVHTDDGVWVVPPDRAVWVPAGIGHRLQMAGRTSIRTLYFAAGLTPLPRRCRAVNVPPLLRELILHALRISPIDLRQPAHGRLIGVLLDQLAASEVAPLQVPLPADSRARDCAAALLADPADRSDVATLARRVGASRRTLERLFRAETGLPVGRWRDRVRLVAALRLLADGEPVSRVAHAVGYATPSAFGAMFVRELGVSPGRYFRAPTVLSGR